MYSAYVIYNTYICIIIEHNIYNEHCYILQAQLQRSVQSARVPTSTVQQFIIRQGSNEPVLLQAGRSTTLPKQTTSQIRTQLKQNQAKPTLYQQIQLPTQNKQYTASITSNNITVPVPAAAASHTVVPSKPATQPQQQKIQISQQALEQIKRQIAAQQAAQGRHATLTASPVKNTTVSAAVNQPPVSQTR